MDTPWLNEQARAPADGSLRTALIDPHQQLRLLREHCLAVDEQDGWLRIHLHAGRQRGMALLSSLVGMAFMAIMLIVPDQGFISTVIRVTSGCFGVSLFLLACYLPFNSLDVRISPRRIERVRNWFGIQIRSREVSSADLVELEIGKSSSSAAGSGTTIYYELVGRGSFGRLKLIESVPDRSLLEAVRQQVMLAAGLSTSARHG